MKTGEFVGADGLTYIVAKGPGDICIRLSGYEWGGKWIGFGHVDYSAALQSLLPQPSVHPAVGLRYCGEEEAFEWDTGIDRFRYEDGVIKGWIPIGRGGDGQMREVPLHCFEAGRRYERRQR